MFYAHCPNCSTPNQFEDQHRNKSGGCKSCRHVWRLSPVVLPVPARLPALPSCPPPAVLASYRIERVTSALTPGVIDRGYITTPKPQELVQVEAVCACHDAPFSVLYARREGETTLRFQRSEKGTGAIDRYCGTAEGRQRLERNGGAVQYDRTIRGVDYRNLSGFSCAWCGASDWFKCQPCGYIICRGRSYKNILGKSFGVCRNSCPEFDPAGLELNSSDVGMVGRKARLSWRGGSSDAPALPCPASQQLRLRGRS